MEEFTVGQRVTLRLAPEHGGTVAKVLDAERGLYMIQLDQGGDPVTYSAAVLAAAK